MPPPDRHASESTPALYAVWRRNTLLGVVVATAIGFLAHAQAAQIQFDFGDEQPPPWIVVSAVVVVILAVGPGLIGTVLAVSALGSWRTLRWSNSLARGAWLFWVLGPLPLLLLPVSHLFHLQEQDAVRTSSHQIRYLLTVTVPSLFALLPGLLSGALVLEKLLPESRAPGQIVLLAAPACLVTYLIPLGILAQIAFHTELYLGVLLLASSPVVPLLSVRRLLRSNPPPEAARLVRRIRIFQRTLVGLGALLLVGWVDEHPQLRQWIGQVDLVWALGFIARVLASQWITSVVVADLLVTLLHHEQVASRSLAATQEGEVLERKLDALGQSLGRIGRQ